MTPVIIVLSALSLGGEPVHRTSYVAPVEHVQVQEEIIEETHILEKIAICESNGKQFDEAGMPLRGVVNASDVGKYQINEYYHLAASQALGIDIYTEEGNTKYAYHLYNREGTDPWNASKSCWLKML